MVIDHEYSMNLMTEEFPENETEYLEFLFHIPFLKLVNRMRRLCLTNPVLAQKQTDPNSRMVAKIMLVSNLITYFNLYFQIKDN